jgi:hypothetical protein
MTKIKLFKYFLISLLIGGCNTFINTNNKLIENEKVAINKQKLVTDSSEESRVIIDNLANGNYGFCKQSVFNHVTSDLEGWCFMFRKNMNHIVGLYTLWLPSDYARICINGTIKNNTITGIGYERLKILL